MSDQEGFLQRWSRRKADARRKEQHEPGDAPPDGHEDAASPEAALAESAPVTRAPAPPAPSEAAAEPVDLAALPDIESLTYESDFTPFLRAGVPKELKNRALRKLWRSNPVLACLDGLNDHDEDYTDAALARPGIKTLYKVGRGLLREPQVADASGVDLETPGAKERPDEPGTSPAAQVIPPADARNEGGQQSGEARSDQDGDPAGERAIADRKA